MQATFAPVDNWDAMLTTDDPDQLGPKGVVAGCDELTVVQNRFFPSAAAGRSNSMRWAMRKSRAIDLYKALGSRITYAQAKEILTIEGDGRSPAELFRQMQPGDPAQPLAGTKNPLFSQDQGTRSQRSCRCSKSKLPDGKKR